MPSNVSGPGRNAPVFDPSLLQGTEIASGGDKVAETTSTRIELSTEIAPGFHVPDLKIAPRTIEDFDARPQIIDVPADRLAEVKTGEDFKALLTELKETHGDYLLPDRQEFAEKIGEDSHFAYNNVTGRRIGSFYDEAMGLVAKTGLTGEDAVAARREVNLSHADAFRGRAIKFDKADTGGYWSYGHDSAFVHVYEKMLDAMPADDPRRETIQNQIDFIFTKKYVPNGKMDENNAEKTMGLVAIDKDSRNVVSMKADTVSNVTPSYETIQVDPNIDNENAGKQVVWDSAQDKYLFQGTTTEVPAELQESFIRTDVQELTFRRAGEEEELRNDFRFDWNGNRMIDSEKINTGWWGHCDIKAVMETIHTDMSGSAGVKEYRADTGKTTDYSRKDLLEAMSSTLNFGGQYVEFGTGKTVHMGETQFGGARNDDRPDNIHLSVGGQYRSFNVRFESMTKPNSDETVDAEKSFSEYTLSDDGKSFEVNEELSQKIQGDTHIISGNDRTIKAKNEYYTVNENGQWVENKDSITISPDTDEKVLLGTDIRSIGDRSLTRYYFNPKTKELSSMDVTFKKNDEGKFVAEEGATHPMGTAHNMLLGKEMQSGDDVEGKTRLTDSAMRSGNSIATDSDKGQEVWNGAMYNIREEVAWRSEDGRFERIDVHVDAVFGTNKSGSKVNELDEEGNVIRTFEDNAPVDFFWRDVPRVAPLIRENGKWYINKAMMDRGIVDLDNLETSLSAISDLNDLLYLGLDSKDNKKVFTIVHDGKRYVYDNEDTWKADVEKLEAAANPTPPANADTITTDN
ncbi:MAG: hypothetical protein EP343_24750 [Deltaproteobacteria bacterium]|nr:MAG: hypothetical protein EP343_24750 [Deltaproteobacteria bacterium]